MNKSILKYREWKKQSRMRTFLEVFKKKHVFTPVLHVQNLEQILRNLKICFSNNVDGVWLISHDCRKVSCLKLLELLKEVRKYYPYGKFWIGINFLDLHPWEVFEKVGEQEVDGIWVDNSFIDDHLEKQKNAEDILMSIFSNNFKGLYMAGIAFKYQKQPKNLELTAKLATQYMDVVVTSGPGTGKEIEDRKTENIRKYIGDDVPLAVASGVSFENCDKIIKFVNLFLVASSIGKDFHNFDEGKLRRLCEKIHSFNQ